MFAAFSGNMAQWNCMRKYRARYPADESNLSEAAGTGEPEFPVVPDFVSLPPRVELQAMLRRIEENMPWRSTRLGERERRFKSKVSVEFVF